MKIIKMMENYKSKKNTISSKITKNNDMNNLFDDLHKLILKIAIKYKVNIYDAYVILGYMHGSKKDYYKKAE